MRTPDNILEFEVKGALGWDPVIVDTRVIVSANGRVTMAATGPSFYDAALAADDACSVGGIVDFDNELVGLVGDALAHADIAADCAAAFYADHFVSQGAVTATPTDAMGTPTGKAFGCNAILDGSRIDVTTPGTRSTSTAPLVPTPLGRKPTTRRGRRRA